MKQLPLDFGLAAVPRLENFIAQGNEAAVWHVQQAVANPQRAAVPTYLWGETGSGKSHLLQAVVTALREQGEPVGWLDAQTLHPAAFDDRWQAVVLDDCHLFTPHQQAVAFNWFVNAQTWQRGVLAAGDAPPADLRLREDLRTRLGWGHVFQLHVLGETERRAVLRQAADARGVFLGDEVMDFMLTRFSRDLGSLMLLLEHLDAYALQTRRAITIPLIKDMLETQ